MSKRTVVFDFDGVIHKYRQGWQNGIIYDEPNEIVVDTIKKLRENNFEVVIVSTRCSTIDGINQIKKWLSNNNIVVDNICKEKPPAFVYIDDRAIHFDPNNKNLYENIISFVPDLIKYQDYSNQSNLATCLSYNAKMLEFNQLFEQVIQSEKDTSSKTKVQQNIILDKLISTIKDYL